MDGSVKVEQPSSFIAIQIVTDLGPILAIISVLGGDLDCVDVSTLCWVCRPLNGRPRPTDTLNDTVQEFEFGDEEMLEQFVRCPNSCAGVEDDLLVLVKE